MDSGFFWSHCSLFFHSTNTYSKAVNNPPGTFYKRKKSYKPNCNNYSYNLCKNKKLKLVSYVFFQGGQDWKSVDRWRCISVCY